MGNSHHYSILYRFTPLNFTGEIDVISEADGSVYNYNVARYRSLTNKHLTIQTTEYFKSKALLIARTNQSDITVCQASQLFSDDFSLETLKSEKTAEKVIQKLTISAEKNRTYTLEKISYCC